MFSWSPKLGGPFRNFYQHPYDNKQKQGNDHCSAHDPRAMCHAELLMFLSGPEEAQTRTPSVFQV